jgi:hypothetical protein
LYDVALVVLFDLHGRSAPAMPSVRRVDVRKCEPGREAQPGCHSCELDEKT